VLEGFWRQSLSAYHDNPLPALFKEKLAASLGRHCTSPYPIVVHSCALRALGAGADQILSLLEKPPPAGSADAERLTGIFAAIVRPLDSWPPPDSDLEEGLLDCLLLFQLRNWRSALGRGKPTLGPKDYAGVIVALSGPYINGWKPILWLPARSSCAAPSAYARNPGWRRS
jgi:hypothetical protein